MAGKKASTPHRNDLRPKNEEIESPWEKEKAEPKYVVTKKMLHCTIVPRMTLSVLQRQKTFAIGLLLILLFSGVVRFWRLSIPTGYYFDEVYHAMTSKLVGRGDPRAFEWWNDPPEKDTAVDWLHPPLAKYTQGLSMVAFGENSFGWRFSSAVFGILTVAATALLAHVAWKRRRITLIATTLVALDGLLLAQSRIAMNDIHVTFAILMAATAYLWYRQQSDRHTLSRKITVRFLLLIGLLSGIAMGTKWSGIFVLVPIGLFEGITLLRTRFTTRANLFNAYWIRILTLVLLPFCIYVLSYGQMFLQGKTLVCTGDQIKQGSCYCSQESSPWVNVLSAISPVNRPYFESLESRGGCKRLISHFSELQNQIWWYQTNLKATHPYQSRPWQWALDLRPVWSSVTYSEDGKTVSNVYTAGNPVLFWGGLIAVLYLLATLTPTLFAAGRNLLSKKSLPVQLPREVLFLIVLYLVLWVPWTFSPRIMFFYHYAPAVPFLAILSAYSLVHLPFSQDKRTKITIGFCVLVAVVFVLLFPVFTGYPMSPEYFERVFTVFPSWK